MVALNIDRIMGTKFGLLTLRLCRPAPLRVNKGAPVNHILAFIEPLQIQEHTRGRYHCNQKSRRKTSDYHYNQDD
jgi:hypothetical protein